MAHKKHSSGPVPLGNRQQGGPGDANEQGGEQDQADIGGPPDQEQDPKRRLGDFTGKGEHSIQQPGGHNDANR